MEKKFKLVGIVGNIPVSEYVEDNLYYLPMRFIEYVKDESGNICGAKFLADEGHGYGFNYGEKEVILHSNEEFQFVHSYTDTSDGTWDNDSFTVKVRLIEE